MKKSSVDKSVPPSVTADGISQVPGTCGHESGPFNEIKFLKDGMTASNGEVSWKIPGEAMADLCDCLIHRKPEKHELRQAATIIQQFMYLMCSEEDYGNKQFRDFGIRFIRKAMKSRGKS